MNLLSWQHMQNGSIPLPFCSPVPPETAVVHGKCFFQSVFLDPVRLTPKGDDCALFLPIWQGRALVVTIALHPTPAAACQAPF